MWPALLWYHKNGPAIAQAQFQSEGMLCPHSSLPMLGTLPALRQAEEPQIPSAESCSQSSKHC